MIFKKRVSWKGSHSLNGSRERNFSVHSNFFSYIPVGHLGCSAFAIKHSNVVCVFLWEEEWLVEMCMSERQVQPRRGENESKE